MPLLIVAPLEFLSRDIRDLLCLFQTTRRRNAEMHPAEYNVGKRSRPFLDHAVQDLGINIAALCGDRLAQNRIRCSKIKHFFRSCTVTIDEMAYQFGRDVET